MPRLRASTWLAVTPECLRAPVGRVRDNVQESGFIGKVPLARLPRRSPGALLRAEIRQPIRGCRPTLHRARLRLGHPSRRQTSWWRDISTSDSALCGRQNLGGHRDRPHRCWYGAPDAVCRSLDRAGAGSATARTRTRLQRPAAAELFAPGGNLAAFLLVSLRAKRPPTRSDYSSFYQQRIRWKSPWRVLE